MVVAPGPILTDHGRSVRRVLARGTIWALAEYAGSQVLRLANNLILWRLLHPEAFGLMAIVTSLFIGLYMFTDVGIGQSIVQHLQSDQCGFGLLHINNYDVGLRLYERPY